MESHLEEGNEVLFINANDNVRKQDIKTWEDVMDVNMRKRFKDGVTFLTMNILRRDSGTLTVVAIKEIDIYFIFSDLNISTYSRVDKSVHQ